MLLFASAPAVAGWDSYSVYKKQDGRYEVGPSMRRMLHDAWKQSEGTTRGGKLDVRTTGRGPVTDVIDVEMKYRRTLTPRDLAKGAFRGGLPGVAWTALSAGAWCYVETGDVFCRDLAPSTPEDRWTYYGQNYSNPAVGCPPGPDPIALHTCAAPAYWLGNQRYTPTTTTITNQSPVQTCSVPAFLGGGSAPCRTVTTVRWFSCVVVGGANDGQACGQVANTRNWSGLNRPVQVCPSIQFGGGTVTPVPDNDGKCPTGTARSPSESDFADRMTPRIQPGDMPGLWDAGKENPGFREGAGENTDPGVFEGPNQVPGGSAEVPGPNGPVTVERYYDIEYGLDGYRVRETTTRQEPGTPPVVEQGPPVEVKTCGLPGTPPCKIDETGTPQAPATTPGADAEGAGAGLRGFVDGITGTSFPAFQWSFALPTTCGVIQVPAFAPYLSTIDVCQFQPLFHDIMTVVWVLGGLFGAIGLFWREQFAGT